MLIATLAIAGVPLLAGFYSKDEILAGAFAFSPRIWIIGVVAAGFTAFYMFRLYFMTFWGTYRGAQVGGIDLDKGHGLHADVHGPHESPLSMTGVLLVLALLSIIGGYVGWPAALGGSHPTPFQRWLEPVLVPLGGEHFEFHEASVASEILLMAISVLIAGTGIFLAWRWYKRDPEWATPRRLATQFAPLHRLLENKYYVDELYNATVIRGTVLLSLFLSWFDKYIVDGLVNGVRNVTLFVLGYGSNLIDQYIVDGAINGLADSARGGSTLFRRMQSGVVQNYAMIMGGGIVLMAVVYLFLKP
jgi:NADH-quinone oxidoreductase subunit L